MAGHSRWAQIKRTKAVVDAKRGAVFTRLGREITVAARGGADPAANFQLRTAIEKAKAARVLSANIERAIAKGSGQGGSGADAFAEVRYEGYGPGGVAVLIEALGLEPEVAQTLTSYPIKGALDPLIPTDPLLYRFYEILQVYGLPLKDVIQEKFGDGIMSAIDFTLTVDKEIAAAGDRVVVTMNGKFLPYKKW